MSTTAWVALAVVVATIALVAATRRARPRDPQRLFTADQRRHGEQQAGGRCEMEGLGWLRCRRPGRHADHWFPHTRGGASTEQNLVWACAPHNLSKSARMPSVGQTWRLARRRTRYFPPGTPTRPGEWFDRAPHERKVTGAP